MTFWPRRTAAWKSLRPKSTASREVCQSTCRSGNFACRRCSRGVSHFCMSEESVLTFTTPPARIRRASRSTATSESSPACTPGSNFAPSGVSSTLRPLRRSTGTCRYSSSALICCETAAGVTFRASAASAKDRRVATASNTRKALSGKRP